MQEGYSICFNEWALDKEIKNELGLLLIISSLCAEKGYCFASNKYLSQLFDVPEQTISRKIKLLENKKYITIEYKKRGCEIIERNIRLTKLLNDDKQKCVSTINKIVKDNNTSINNTSINIKEKSIKRKFEKPTIEQIQQYCIERNNGINAEAFYDFYESKNWYVGKNKMSDWKACVRTWEKRSNKINEPIPDWFDKKIEKQNPTQAEQNEMEDLLKKYR